MSSLPVTPSQTVGPFFSPCLLKDDMRVLIGPGSDGARIRIEGRVSDGDGAPVSDAVVEIWQANAHGRYNHPLDTRDLPLDPEFTGFGRCGTDDDGRFSFETVKPGPAPFNETTMQAPHICVTVYGRGLLNHLATRLYFDDESSVATDPVLLCVPAELRSTLLARRQPAGAIATYRFDIVLQGEGETSFFDL